MDPVIKPKSEHLKINNKFQNISFKCVLEDGREYYCNNLEDILDQDVFIRGLQLKNDCIEIRDFDVKDEKIHLLNEEISDLKNKIQNFETPQRLLPILNTRIHEYDKDNFFNRKMHPFGYPPQLGCECRTCREYYLRHSLLNKIIPK